MSNQSHNFTFPEVRVVEASAGSGKTYTLAKRYIQLLLLYANSKAPHGLNLPMKNILAITFTNKAAFEMKTRILDFFKKIALNQLSAKEEETFLKPCQLSRDQAVQLAYALMDAVIYHYNFFQVQTIDKFINALLSGCAFKIGLTSNFRIKTNSREYLEHSLDELIDKAPSSRPLASIFDFFLRNYLYIENRSGWFPKKDMLVILRRLFAVHNAYGCQFREGPVSPEDLMKKKRVILEKLNKLNELFPEAVHKGFQKELRNFLAKYTNGFDIDKLSEYLKREELPINKGGKATSELVRLWASIQKDIRELCVDEANSLFNPYIRVFEEVLGGFLKLCAKDDVLFLEELNKKARQLFDEEYVTVEELYYRLATRFHHYLIDEFQDTSRLQWKNVEAMVAEALATGGSLFYVGDRKQAIYGFRGGDARLFGEIKDQFTALDYNVNTEFLTNNFRSHKAIVEFNNFVFSPGNLQRFVLEKQAHENAKHNNTKVILSQSAIDEITNVFAGAQQTYNENHHQGYVKVRYVDGNNKGERNDVVRDETISLIRDLRKRFSFSQIAILMRSNTEIEEVTRWLLEEGIAVESERTSDITKHALVGELVAFLKFLDAPIDNFCFAQFILGDIFARATGHPSEEYHRFIFSLNKRRENEKGLYLYTAFREAYPDIWETYLAGFFKNIGLYPLYELVVSIYHTFRCLEYFPNDQAFLMHFLELIKKAEEDYTDAASFIEYFEELEGEDVYIHATDTEAVKLSTYHKAKGLEFPVVIIPCLGIDVQVGSQGSSDQKQSYVLAPQEDGMHLLRLKNKYYSFCDDLYGIYAEEYKKALVVELNSLYVALTRAKQELYIFIPKSVGRSTNLAQFLIPEHLYETGTAAVNYHNEDPKISPFLDLAPGRYQDWIDYLKDEFSPDEELRHRARRLAGESMHHLLSMVGNLKNENIEALTARCLSQAGLRFAEILMDPHYTRKLKEVLAHKDCRKFFYLEKGEIFTERELVVKNGQTKRVDRLIVQDDSVWVIDYKAGIDPKSGDVMQVKEYVSVLRELYPQKTIEGFLVYLEQMRILNVNDDQR